jgi:hypothetical protein
MTSASTLELFAAIDAHSSHHAHLDPTIDDAASARVRAALAAGADWREPLGPAQRDAACTAAIVGGGGPLEALLDHGVPPDHAHDHHGMLIHQAAAFSNLGAIKLLVSRGVAPDVRDLHNRTPLGVARAWKHGADAVPLLISLMRAHGCTPAKAERGDDLHRDVVQEAIDAATPAVLRSVVDAFFVERVGGKSVDLLRALAEQGDEQALLAGVSLVRKTSTATPKAKRIAASSNNKAKRVDVVHHGDVHIEGNADAQTLVVTGSLRVDGLLTNHEGCVIAVGESMEVHALWTEGPCVVGGNLSARDVLGCGDHHHASIVVGDVVTPVFVHLDGHRVNASRMRAGITVTTRAAVPDGAFQALRWSKR